jgi:hypothetical protein
MPFRSGGAEQENRTERSDPQHSRILIISHKPGHSTTVLGDVPGNVEADRCLQRLAGVAEMNEFKARIPSSGAQTKGRHPAPLQFALPTTVLKTLMQNAMLRSR